MKTLPKNLSGNEKIVRRLVLNLLRNGCPPSQIRISGGQNPKLKDWSKKKGITWDPKQKFDILHPEKYSMES